MSRWNNVIICDGELEIVKITEDLFDQAVELYQKYFMKYENVSIAMNLLGSQQSINEMEVLIRAILKDGVSFAAVCRQTKELVAMCINKICCPRTGCTLDPVFESFQTPAMKYVGHYLDRMEGTYNLYKEWHIDCLIEIVFLSTRHDFARRGLAFTLSQHTMQYARHMSAGTLPQKEKDQLPSHVRGLRPQAICSVFTSRFSQKVGEKLGLKTLNKVSNTEFAFEGKTFAEKIDPIHEYSTFAGLRL